MNIWKSEKINFDFKYMKSGSEYDIFAPSWSSSLHFLTCWDFLDGSFGKTLKANEEVGESQKDDLASQNDMERYMAACTSSDGFDRRRGLAAWSFRLAYSPSLEEFGCACPFKMQLNWTF